MKKHIKRGFVLFGTALALCLAALGWAEIKEGKGKVGGEVVRASAAAKLSLAPIFSDNMVLQRQMVGVPGQNGRRSRGENAIGKNDER